MRRKDKLLHITKLNQRINESKFSWDGKYANDEESIIEGSFETRKLTPKEMTQIMKDAERLTQKDKYFDFNQDTAVRVLWPAEGGGEYERTIVTNYNDIANTEVRIDDRISNVIGNMNYTDAYKAKETSKNVTEHHTGEYSDMIMNMKMSEFLDALKGKDEMAYNIVEEVIEKHFTETTDEGMGLPGDFEPKMNEDEPTDVESSKWFSDTDGERLTDKCMDC
jgi:hypothetical protein